MTRYIGGMVSGDRWQTKGNEQWTMSNGQGTACEGASHRHLTSDITQPT